MNTGFSAGRLPLLVICGPTGVGKSALALLMAGRFGGEIISADAFQFYRGLDIGTAKPSPAERALAVHHLVDCLSPDERANAFWFARRVRALIPEIRARNRMPILAGGSGLYLKTVLDWFFELPDRTAVSAAEAALSGLDGTEMHRRLALADPEAAGRINPRDLFRLRRALAVYQATGRPISAFQKENRPLDGDIRLFGVFRERQELHRRIDDRVETMFASGFAGEVAALRRRYDFDAPAFAAIGYRETAAFLDGRASLGETKALVARRTRQYARKQLIWLKRDRRIAWLDFTGREI